ncbi:MAG: SpoIIE family protein phosphatase [Bacteroidetes bacterium]|nr:SpoIIE family protein phosphatase [Bacteroidota bacterium]
MKKISLLSVISLILSCVYTVHAQTYFNKIYNVEEGLAQSDVLALYQEKNGNLWIGTNGGGLNIYNGREFMLLTTDNGLIDNVIYSVMQDSEGAFWIGTSKGISIYDGGSFTNLSVSDGLPHSRVYKIIEDRSGTIWCGTEKGVATVRNGKVERFTENKILEKSFVYCIYIDSRKTIWFGTYGKGVVRYNTETGEFTNYTRKEKLYSNYIRDFVEDTDGNIWIGTWEGCNIYMSRSDEITRIAKSDEVSPETVGAFILAGSGQIVNVNYSSDLSWLDKDMNTTDFRKFPGCLFWTAIEDNEGNIWLGSIGRGLMKLPPPVFYNYGEDESGLHNNNVFAITKIYNGKYLVGCSSKGVAELTVGKFDKPSVQKISYTESLTGRFAGTNIAAILQARDSSIWIGTSDGLTLLRKDSTFTNFSKAGNPRHVFYPCTEENLVSDKIQALFEDSKKNIWIGTNKGVTVVKSKKFYDFGKEYPALGEKSIWSIFEDRDKSLWFTTDTGAYNFKNKVLTHFGKAEGFADDRVVSVVQDKQGHLWFGTKQGVFRYDYKEFAKIDMSTGLSSNSIYLIIPDGRGNLFVGSNKGLDRINVELYNKTGEIKIRNYGSLEGFMGQECNVNACFRDDDGKIWFGTVKGITIYNPEYDKINNVVPYTEINKIRLAYKDVDWNMYTETDSSTRLPVDLVLPYDKNHLTFEFVAASLSIPEKIRYQYILEGLTKEWSPPAAKNEADYPILPAGEYVFKVKACNNDGIWNESPTVFRFRITPPFWKTWWFYTIIGILAIIIIYAYMKYREAALRRDKIRLEKTVAERTAEVVKQKEIVEQKNKDITDSINYAKNIQNAILPRLEMIKESYEQSFVLFKPRDIVSGDFYWFNRTGDYTFFAAVDCTGHGVPGAFMSMLGVAFLNEIVNKDGISSTDEILNHLRHLVIEALDQHGNVGESKDGMDIVVVAVNNNMKKLQYSGANNPLYLVRKKELPGFDDTKCTTIEDYNLFEFKADKMPIAHFIMMAPFGKQEIDLIESDTLYFFSDGYIDQFGGPEGKKFKAKQFKELIISLQQEGMEEQRIILDKKIEEWRTFNYPVGILEQVDDILVIGVKI